MDEGTFVVGSGSEEGVINFCVYVIAPQVVWNEIYSSSKFEQLFETMHRCSSFDKDTATKSLQVEGLFIGLSPFNVQQRQYIRYIQGLCVQSVLRMRENAERTRGKRVRQVQKWPVLLIGIVTLDAIKFHGSLK